jgi:hypothetical protein
MYLASSAGSHIDKLPASGPVEFDDMNHSRRHEGLCSGCSTDLDLARLVRRHRQPHSIPPSSKGRTFPTTGDRRLLPVSSRSAHTSSGQDQELASVIDDKDRLFRRTSPKPHRIRNIVYQHINILLSTFL